MTCTDWHDKFSDIFEGRGDQALSAALHEHLRKCAACRAAYAEFEAAWHSLDSLASAESVELPPGFHVSLLARIEQEQLERAYERKKTLRARLRDLFLGSRSPRTTLVYAAVAVVIALCIILIPNPLRESGARLLGFGPDSSVIEPVIRPAPEAPEPTVADTPEVTEEPEERAMPTGDEPGPSVEVGWIPSGDYGHSVPHITLTNHGSESVDAALELLAGISPSPLPTGADTQGPPTVIWSGQLAASEPVEVAVPRSGAADKAAAHLVVMWDHSNNAMYVFLPTQESDGQTGHANIALSHPEKSTDYALGCIAAQAGVMIVCDRRFDQAPGLLGEDSLLSFEEALQRVRPPDCSLRHDRQKQIVYIEGNEH